MKGDIVERLRAVGQKLGAPLSDDEKREGIEPQRLIDAAVSMVFDEAAQEIEALRGRVAEMEHKIESLLSSDGE